MTLPVSSEPKTQFSAVESKSNAKDSVERAHARVIGLAVLVGGYLILLSAVMVYTLYALWWTPVPAIQNVPSASLRVVQFLVWNFQVDADRRLLLVTLTAGTLGGIVHALRSLFWYVGNRKFTQSWTLMYVCLPITGGLLGLGAFFLIGAGLLVLNQGGAPSANSTSPVSAAGLPFLIGMFSQQAALKLQQLAETVFTRPDPGSDAKPQGSSSPTEAPDFFLVISPPSHSPNAADQSVQFTVTLMPSGGFASNVMLSLDDFPAAFTSPPKFSPEIVKPGPGTAISALTIDTTGLPSGMHTIGVKGGADDRIRKASATIVIS